MKNLNMKKIIQSAALAILAAGTLLGSAILRPQQVSAAVLPSQTVPAVTEGSYGLGTAGISDGRYVYYGTTNAGEPLLWRVLDADTDNAGATGAMLLFSEQVIERNVRFSVQSDDQAKYLFDENSPLHLGRFEHTYQGSFLSENIDAGLSANEMAAIRAITKTDLNVNTLYGIDKWKTDELFIRRNDAGTANEVYSAPALNNDRIFPLSVEELDHYFGNGALATESADGNYPSSWWLRTAYANDGLDQVGAVDVNGKVTPVDADATNVGGRYALNVEHSRVTYTKLVGSNTYRLALLHSAYDTTDENALFSASVVDVKNGKVTIAYQNAIGRDVSDPQNLDGEDEFISVIVKNDASGRIEFYGSVAYAPDGNGSEQLITDKNSVTFDVPEGYDEDTDTMYVFWERRNNSDLKTTYTSNLFALECVHKEGSAATCERFAQCGYDACQKYYGTYDLDNHVGTHYVTNYEEDTHELHCDSPHCQLGGFLLGEGCEIEANCTSLIQPCVCGNAQLNPDKHSFVNGICEYDDTHYQEPTLVSGYYQIKNVGNLLWFRDEVNNGNNAINAKLAVSVLDFTGADMWEYGIGTETSPFKGTFDGNGNTVKGIRYRYQNEYLALFDYTDGATVKNLTLREIAIGNTNITAAILIGYAKDTAVSDCLILDSSIGTRRDYGLGAVIGEATGTVTVTRTVVYGAVDSNRNHLPIVGIGSVTLDHSFALSDEADEQGGRTAEQFASGALAYQMGGVWGQTLGTDPYPVRNGAAVYYVQGCGQQSGFVYSNVNANGAHSYTDVINFVWDVESGYNYCKVRTKCAFCGEENPELIECDVTVDYEYWMDEEGRAVRIKNTASVILGGKTVSEDYIILASKYRIENQTVISTVEKDFDGEIIYPSDLINTRLKSKYYNAYFVDRVTGKHMLWVAGAGSYDLVIEGYDDGDEYHRARNAYGGQKMTRENAVVIKPIEVTLDIKGEDKIWDGSKDVDPIYTMDPELPEEWFEITLSDAPSANVGVYTVNVTLKYLKRFGGGPFPSEYYEPYDFFTEVYCKSVTLKYNTTAQVEILPRTHVSIENKDYQTVYTYGDVLPDPTAANFNTDAGSNLTFEWYAAEYDRYTNAFVPLYKLSAKPTAAGEYILRVRGTSTENYIASYVDIPVTVARKALSITFGNGVTWDEESGVWTATIEAGRTFDYSVLGLINGDTLESAGITVSIVARYDGYNGYGQVEEKYLSNHFPIIAGTYAITFNATCLNYYDTGYNYEGAYVTVYVRVLAVTPAPAEGTHTHDGNKKGVGISFEYPATSLLELNTYYISYSIVLYREDVEVVSDSLNGQYLTDAFQSFFCEIDKPGNYTLKVSASVNYYTNNGTDSAYENDYYVKSFTVSFGEGVTEIREIGAYTVTVTTGEAVRTATVEVVNGASVKQELKINVKEFVLELTSGLPVFQITDVSFVPGFGLKSGHTLVDLTYRIRLDYNDLEIVDWVIVDGEQNDVSHLYKATTAGYDVHIYDNPCDSECNLCDETRAVSAHRGGEATCVDLAICEICGMGYGTFDLNNHVSNKTTDVPNVNDLNTHAHVHACCGTVISLGEHYGGTATCTELAKCELCAFGYGELDPNNHSSNQHSHASRGAGENEHSVLHACCGAFIKIEKHTGGTPTCKTQAVCTLCGDSYGGLDAAHHVGGVATCRDLAVCTLCGERYGELDPDNHTSEHTAYAPSVSDPTLHEIIRSCCGEVLSTEEHSGGTANCTTAAKCEHCSAIYGAKDPNVHASDSFIYKVSAADAEQHDKLHACCGAHEATEAHSGGSANCSSGAICEHCGSAYGAMGEHVYDHACDFTCNVCNRATRAIAFHADENDDGLCDACGAEMPSRPLSGGAISGIAVGSVAIAGGGGFSLFWFVIKKKNWAQLIRFLIG
ncbi:MAG: hypothetical protein IJW16_08400 [Clostridia bacterium]|nr:hypothetical protein [Clostridia bacterium]